MVSAAVVILGGATDKLFFCNANIYRATGTSYRSKIDAVYVARLRMEKKRCTEAPGSFAKGQ